MKIFFTILFLFSSNVFSTQVYLKDLECKVMHEGSFIDITQGTLATYHCENNDNPNVFICTYFDKNGNKLNEPDLYIQSFNDEKTHAYWKSDKGNISIHFDLQNSRYYMSMSYFNPKYMELIGKFCNGIFMKK